MTTEIKILDLSYEAAEDLSNDQYRFVVLTSNNTVRRPDSETEVALGILQNAPAAGGAAVVRIAGVSKAEVNASLGVGTFVMPEYVSATDAGKAKTSAGALQYTRALVVESSGAEDDLASVLLTSPFPAINDAVAQVTTVTTKTTGGDVTYTAAEIVGGMILRDPNGANRADLVPTAANIVNAIAGAIVGSSFEFIIRNNTDTSEVITVTTNTGITLSGVMTIAPHSSRRFRAVCTNVTAASEAVTIYSVETVVHAVDATSDTIATTSNTDVTVIVPEAGVLVSAEFLGFDNLAAHDTNFITFSVTNLGQDGDGTTVMLAAADSNTTKATGGTALTKGVVRTLVLHGTPANLVVAKGDRLRIRAAADGTLANTVTGPLYMLRIQ